MRALLSMAMATPQRIEVADATDTETQSDSPLQVRADGSLTNRQLAVRVLAGTCLLAAVATAAAITQKSAPAQTWREVDTVSKNAHKIEPDTGCSDWEKNQIGKLLTASNDLDCLNKCLVVTGAKYANFQDDHCASDVNGAHKGACYCFKDCTKVTNTCWDLIATNMEGSESTAATTAAVATTTTTTSTTYPR